jgi:simple sugar transport system ATP-binding protein
MVGEGIEIAPTPRTAPPARDTALLAVRDLTLAPRGAKPLLNAIAFTVAPGEIFGIAGVDGNGQEPLAECLSGLLVPTSGEIVVGGTPLPATPQAFRAAQVATIPADRHRRGLALPMTITENLALGVYDKPEYQQGPLLRWKQLRARAENLVQAFDIRTTGTEVAAQSLSGGNQQKVVIARALSDKPRVVIAVNPTRGLDVGAISYVHAALRKAQAEGAAIVLLSTELDEVLALSDRVGVLFDGALVGIVPPDTPRERLGALMGGAA